MKKILIITADNVDDSEMIYPYFRLIEEGYKVEIASFRKDVIHAKYHFSINSDLTFKNVKVKDYAGLYLPGGTAPEKIRLDKDALNIVKEFNKAHKPIAAICHGPQILISAGVLKGVNATCYPGIKDDLINAGAKYEDRIVIVDHNIVTSRRPADMSYLMKEFIRLIKSK